MAAVSTEGATTPTIGAVQAIGTNSVASIGSAEPTPRIVANLKNGTRIESFPDSRSCINLKDLRSLEQ